MEITKTKENNYLNLIIDGDLDASSAIYLDESIQKALEDNESIILIDCKKLDYISSAGLGVFMSYLKDFEERNVSMILFGLSDKVNNVFKILGLDNLLQIVETKEDALKTIA